MAIKKVPKNFDNNLNRRKQHLNEVIDQLNNITDVVANPEGTATAELENLQIGDTIYAVNKPTFEFIKALRLTVASGGEYRTDKPAIQFYDDGGNVLSIAANEYTATCDKSYAGNIELQNVCSIASSDAPGAFTYVFNNDLEVSNFHLIKLTRAGAFAGDIAKNIKLELSSNGTDFITLWEDPAIVWSDATPYRIIDIKTGNVSNTLLPIVTSADNGKVLGVVNGVWDKNTIPALPSVSSSDNGKIVYVKQGNWNKTEVPPFYILRGSLSGTNVNISSFPVAPRFSDSKFNNGENFIIFILDVDDNHREYYYLDTITKDGSSYTIVFKNMSGTHTITCVGAASSNILSGTYT